MMHSIKLALVATFLISSVFVVAQNTINNSDNYCYAKLKTPDVYDDVSEQILLRPASQKNIKTPAEYNTISETIIIHPESTKIIYVPATYQMVEEKVIDRPESKKIIAIPAVLDIRMERVLIQEESKRLVIIPATYEMVTEKILVRPEVKRIIPIPAEYQTITEQVKAKAATQRFIPVPAVYETATESIEIVPVTTRTETLTPQFKTVEERVLIKPKYTKWIEKQGDKNCLSADPKDCTVWCMVEVPDEYKTFTKTINIGCDGSGVANSGCIKKIPVPAQYQSHSKQVLVTPATTREEIIPAEYASVTRSVIKTPATTKENITPAKYNTYTKRIVKTPATTQEEIIPAQYKEIRTEIIISPATTREEIIPATYKTIQQRVIKTPATTREETTPAQYKTISKRVLVTPEQVTMQEIPAEYTTITKRILRKKGDMQWKRIVCPRHQTAELNRNLQQALKDAGYHPGPNDNIFGTRTYAAMVQFQKDNNMWQGHLDYATAAALNLTLLPAAYQNENESAIANNSSNANANANGTDVIMTSRGGNGETQTGSNNNTQATNGSSNNSNNSSTETDMSSEELQMIAEINIMRKNPKGYVKHVQDYINQVKNDAGLDAAYKAEEISSAQELINELKSMNPLPEIKPHKGLHQVAIKHGKDVQGQGMIGHRGSDGTMPWDRVRRDTKLSDGNENLVAGGESIRESLMILLVDSGISGRGHRKTLFEPKWTHGGMYKIGDVGGIPNAWIQVFGSD